MSASTSTQPNLSQYRAVVADPNFTCSISSQWPDVNYGPNYRFLDGTNAWIVNTNDTTDKYTVRSNDLQSFVAITTQGRADYDQWMKSYEIKYSVDGVNFFSYNNGQVFTANTDRNTHVTHYFTPPITARAISIHPLTWNGRTSIRFEVYVDPNFVPTNAYQIIPNSRILGNWKENDNSSQLTVYRYKIKVSSTDYNIDSWITPTSFVAKHGTQAYLHYIDESTQTLMRVHLDSRNPTNPSVVHYYPHTALNITSNLLGY